MAEQTVHTTTEQPLISEVTVISLLLTVAYVVFGVIVAKIGGKKLSRADFWVLVWLVFDVLIHLTLEGPFVVISLIGTVLKSNHFTALVWKEYAKADIRWGVSDPTIVSLEILTVTVVELFAVILIYAVIKSKPYRHFLQICLCVCELYGGWMTFCPEWLTGNVNLKTDNFLHLWVYLVFFNMLWVIIPLLLLWQSWTTLISAFNEEGLLMDEREEKTVTTNVYRTYNLRSKTKSS